MAYNNFLKKKKTRLKQIGEKRRSKRSRPSGSIRAESEDEAYQMDKLSQQDWANLEDDHPKVIPEIEVEKEECVKKNFISSN